MVGDEMVFPNGIDRNIVAARLPNLKEFQDWKNSYVEKYIGPIQTGERRKN